MIHLTKPKLTCIIILGLKQFSKLLALLEARNNCLESKLRSNFEGFGDQFGCSRTWNSSLLAATLKPKANQPKPVSSSPSVLLRHRNHAQPPTGVIVVVVVRSLRYMGFQSPKFSTLPTWCHGLSCAVKATTEPHRLVPPLAGPSSPYLCLSLTLSLSLSMHGDRGSWDGSRRASPPLCHGFFGGK